MASEYTQKLRIKLDDVESWLARELSAVRTGRATPAVLDSVSVLYYGAINKISHVAAISIEDAKTLRISPWDKGAIKPIETALSAANLGLSVAVDGEGLRIMFPDLTSERRVMLGKIVKDKQEEARVAVKRDREEILSEIGADEKKSLISEDERFRIKDEIQSIVNEYNEKIESAVSRKIEEIGK